jgi:protocatechuate 3,4-dioxygenase beta subunit
MTRHLALALATLFVTPLAAQDVEYIRAVEAAQKSRPAQISSAARIAPSSEPGPALVIHGRAFREDGSTPLADAVVFAYHTGVDGLYDKAGSPPHSWRLKGWARTDRDGRFEFTTIRPGSYPNSRNPAHVHFTIFTADGARYHAGEVQFEDDPVLEERHRTQSRAEGAFGSVRPVRRDGSVQHVDFATRLVASQRF